MLDALGLSTWVALVEFTGGLLIAGYCLVGLGLLLRTLRPQEARLVVANGALLGLSFKLAAALLNAIGTPTWEHLARLAVIFALRTLLGRVFAWEQGRLRRPRA
ncbi:MAG TPA: DUF1622 domain-containing protein [Stenomitos sp.]